MPPNKERHCFHVFFFHGTTWKCLQQVLRDAIVCRILFKTDREIDLGKKKKNIYWACYITVKTIVFVMLRKCDSVKCYLLKMKVVKLINNILNPCPHGHTTQRSQGSDPEGYVPLSCTTMPFYCHLSDPLNSTSVLFRLPGPHEARFERRAWRSWTQRATRPPRPDLCTWIARIPWTAGERRTEGAFAKESWSVFQLSFS